MFVYCQLPNVVNKCFEQPEEFFKLCSAGSHWLTRQTGSKQQMKLYARKSCLTVMKPYLKVKIMKSYLWVKTVQTRFCIWIWLKHCVGGGGVWSNTVYWGGRLKFDLFFVKYKQMSQERGVKHGVFKERQIQSQTCTEFLPMVLLSVQSEKASSSSSNIESPS